MFRTDSPKRVTLTLVPVPSPPLHVGIEFLDNPSPDSSPSHQQASGGQETHTRSVRWEQMIGSRGGWGGIIDLDHSTHRKLYGQSGEAMDRETWEA